MSNKLKTMMSEVESSTHPIAKALQKTALNKLLTIAFKKGMSLKEHKASMPTTIYLLEGKMLYNSSENSVVMHKYDEIEIPSNLPHSVEALEDSLLMLVQG